MEAKGKDRGSLSGDPSRFRRFCPEELAQLPEGLAAPMEIMTTWDRILRAGSKVPAQVPVPPGFSGLEIAYLADPIEALADRFGWTLDAWEEDGLGEAVGCFVLTAAGRTVMLYDLLPARTMGWGGVKLKSDCRDIVDFGTEVLLVDAISSLDLAESSVRWRADSASTLSLAQSAIRRGPPTAG